MRLRRSKYYMYLRFEKIINKIFTFCKKPLPVWLFLLFLTAIFIFELLKFNISGTLYEGLTYTLSTVFGGFVAFTIQRQNEKKINLSNQINIAQATVRYLSLQYIQLINIERDLENRQILLQKAKEIINKKSEIPRNELISITQDFREDIYRIDLSKLYSLTVPESNRSEFDESLLSAFLLDRKYLATINCLLDINRAKREFLEKNNDQPYKVISIFFDNILSDRLNIVKTAIDKNLTTVDELQSSFKKFFGKDFKEIKYGEIYSKK